MVTADIALARVHIECAIQRMKVFRILSGKMNWELLNQIDNIMIVVCGMVNLTSSISDDSKFM